MSTDENPTVYELTLAQFNELRTKQNKTKEGLCPIHRINKKPDWNKLRQTDN